MKYLKTPLVTGIIAVFTMLAPASTVIAGAGPEPPADAVISDTQIWGVVTMYCSPTVSDLVVLSIKRVVDCNVETQLFVEYAWIAGCPAAGEESAPLDWSLGGYTFFDIPGTPYIRKIKHFMQEIDGGGTGTNVTTFEAQFGFWQPATP